MRRYRLNKVKKIIIPIVIIIFLSIIIFVDIKRSLATKYVDCNDVDIDNVYMLDDEGIAFNIKTNCDYVIGRNITYKDNKNIVIQLFRTPIKKKHNDNNDICSKIFFTKHNCEKVILKSGSEEKILWQSGDKTTSADKKVNDFVKSSSCLKAEGYPEVTDNEILYDNLDVYRYGITSYSDYYEKQTDDNYVYNYVQKCKNSNNLVYWIEALDSNGKKIKVSSEYSQKSENVSKMKIDTKFSKKGTKLRLCVKNKKLSRNNAYTSGMIDLR